jgi:hypothetical protein
MTLATAMPQRCRMRARLFASCVMVLGTPILALAGSGDPRLINGVLEWPRAVTNESFVIVRGDDGMLYYVGIMAVRRDGALRGARVSILGIEGRNPQEITAVGFGSGATAEVAMAQMQGGPPAATAPTVSAPVPVAIAAPSTAPPAPVMTPPAPAVAAPAAAPVARVAASPVTTPSVAPIAAPAGPAPPAVAVPVVAPATTAPTSPMIPADDRRWTEITGEVETLVGRTLVLKVDGGRVSVDVSSLSANLDRMVAPGSKVKIYGVPVELRFKALGFIDPDVRPRSR